MANDLDEIRWEFAAALIIFGYVLIGWADYISGIEVRVYPLYFLPLSLAAWRFGKVGAILASVVATFIWDLANWAENPDFHYSINPIWILNTLLQAVAFGTVAALILWVRSRLKLEEGLSRIDSLTGLANIRALYSSAGLAIAACRRNSRPFTLAYIDLDNFKCVNDRYGHSRGDALLRDVANILINSLRVTDMAARVGGDEFVVCLPDTSESQARPLLERIRAALEVVFPKGECAISASIGAYSWDVPPESVDEMMSTADQIMYKVKTGGKNRMEIHKCVAR